MVGDLGGATRMMIAAPFWDKQGAAIDRLCKKLGLDDVFIHAHASGTVEGKAGSNWPFGSHSKVNPVRLKVMDDKDERRLHAKAFEVLCKRGRILVSGSANGTVAGLEADGNVEACIVRIQRDRTVGWKYIASDPPEPQVALEIPEAGSGCNRNALQVRTREQLPQDWAATQNNLGIALSDLGKRSEGAPAVAYLEQAVAAFRNALQVYTREQLPQSWAMMQNNLGNALRDLAVRSEGAQTTAYLKQAVAAYRDALQAYTRKQLPQDWAMTQNNLGTALSGLGERIEGAPAKVYLGQAVAAYRNALQVYTREQLPQNWAMQVRTRDQLPQGWAMTQNNLGNALSDLARRSEGAQPAYLEQAVAAYRNALQVINEHDSPNEWVHTMVNLALTYERKADWTNARQCYQALLRHHPGNTALSAKLKDLADKR